VIPIKLKFFFLLLLLVVAMSLYLIHPDSPYNKEKEVESLKSKLNEYKVDKYKADLEEEKIKALIDPQIIIDKLESTGQLITYKGNVTYSNHIEESKFYGTRSLTYKFTYEFGIGMDLSHIKVEKIYGETVILSVPKSELKLVYLELKEDVMKSNNTWFASDFDPEIVNVVMQQANGRVREEVLNNSDVFESGLDSLKSNVEELVKKLGFEEVIFQEV
jgi:hypothetical protein